ncbi:hypothetical protein ABIB42_003771 [Massilia sp. UYP32]|uniref:hypothetical protein n=1 Tax=Massilia sp. UYP32 TaxID=1756386 RepID=UPI003D25BE88
MIKITRSTVSPLTRAIASLLLPLTLVTLTTGCSSKPDASDVEPYVIADLGACALWKISDVSKADGVAENDSYRVDFTAMLTLKDSPEKAWEDSTQPRSVASTQACNIYWVVLLNKGGAVAIPEPRLPGLSLSKQYKVAGSAVMVKSEKGWQLAQEIGGLTFEPIM